MKGHIHATRLTELENDSLEMIWVSIQNYNQRIFLGFVTDLLGSQQVRSQNS